MYIAIFQNLLPGLSVGTIFVSPLFVADGIAIIGLPKPSRPNAAPLIKSI